MGAQTVAHHRRLSKWKPSDARLDLNWISVGLSSLLLTWMIRTGEPAPET